MSERDSYRVVRLNERVKLYSGILANLTTALIAAIAYRLFVEYKRDLTALIWMVVATIIICAAHALIGLVEPEDTDDVR